MNKIKLEPNYSAYQKLQLSLGAFLMLFFIVSLTSPHLRLLGFSLLAIFILIFILLVTLIFMKKGFFIEDKKLFFAYFLGNSIIYKYEVDLDQKTAFCISKTKKNQKYAFAAKGNPDMATQYSDFTFYLLNERHTKKDELISILNEENVGKVTDLLTQHFNLLAESYNPRFR